MDTTHLHYPVSATYTPDGIESPGIAYEDYTRMSTVQCKLNSSRRMETPKWALNDKLLSEVIVKYMEFRAGKTTQGSPCERLAAAEANLLQYRPMQIAKLRRLCGEFAAMKKAAEPDKVWLRKRAVQIENLDTQLRLLDKIPAKLAAIVRLYYRVGWDSAQIGQELGLKPPHVRQLLLRLKIAAEKPFQRKNCYLSRIDETGKVYGRWTVLHFFGKKYDSECYWLCRCVCGDEKPVAGSSLRTGSSTQCRNCSRREKPLCSVRRREKIAAGICGTGQCQNLRWGKLAECEKHILYNRARDRERYLREKKRLAIAPAESAKQTTRPESQSDMLSSAARPETKQAVRS